MPLSTRDTLIAIVEEFPLLSAAAALSAIALLVSAMLKGAFAWTLLPQWIMATVLLAAVLRALKTVHFILTVR